MQEITVRESIRLAVDTFGSDRDPLVLLIPGAGAPATVPSSLASNVATARCPLLVIHGSDDPLVPLDHGEATARLVPNSTLVRLEGAGHMFFHEETWREIGRALASHTDSRIHKAGP